MANSELILPRSCTDTLRMLAMWFILATTQVSWFKLTILGVPRRPPHARTGSRRMNPSLRMRINVTPVGV